MDETSTELRSVLTAYPAERQPVYVEALGPAGGFSGAQFWRLTTPSGLLCLRRWPAEHPTQERLEFIQAVLWHVDHEGCHLVPVPCETLSHAGYVRHAGHFWELAPWLPGKADFHADPTPSRLAAAMEALAGFHEATIGFPLPHPQPTLSPGVLERRHELHRLLGGGLVRLKDAIDERVWPALAQRARPLLLLFARVAPAVLELLDDAAGRAAPVSPCIRDIWHDHVLFQGPRVSGLIDFGAMRPDNVATDVARLLGSLVGDDAAGWRAGLAAYEAVRPLSANEALLVTAFDRASVLLSGIHWLRWSFVEERRFDDPEAVLGRVDQILGRLEHLASHLGPAATLELG